jgi:hypothetical protein
MKLVSSIFCGRRKTANSKMSFMFNFRI